MKLRTMVAGTALAALVAAPAASAQQVDLGGVVHGSMELVLTPPTKGFASFTRTRSYEMSFNATAITTQSPSLLTLADGDATSGSRLGYISVGKKRLASPLEARIGNSGAFQPLNNSVDPVLRRWSDVTSRSNGNATVRLRQKNKGRSTGNYRKVVLVTLSTETP